MPPAWPRAAASACAGPSLSFLSYACHTLQASQSWDCLPRRPCLLQPAHPLPAPGSTHSPCRAGLPCDLLPRPSLKCVRQLPVLDRGHVQLHKPPSLGIVKRWAVVCLQPGLLLQLKQLLLTLLAPSGPCAGSRQPGVQSTAWPLDFCKTGVEHSVKCQDSALAGPCNKAMVRALMTGQHMAS